MKNNFYKNCEILQKKQMELPVIFQCDDYYFYNFGIYNLLSCNEVGQDVHIHLINPSNKLVSDLINADLDIKLGISYETVNTLINQYKLKSYYYCARYFIAQELFEKNFIDSAYITDCDIIFNKKITFEKNVSLGILHYPYHNNLWKQTGANFTYVTSQRRSFIDNTINEYISRLENTNFDLISDKMDKITKANIFALDQVCMSLALQKETNFTNLAEIPKFCSKHRDSDIWSLTGGNQKNDPKVHDFLKNKFSPQVYRINTLQ